MDPLLWPKEVASLLNISVRTVYKNFRKLGGFYPAGMRVLRFRPDVIMALWRERGGWRFKLLSRGKKYI